MISMVNCVNLMLGTLWHWVLMWTVFTFMPTDWMIVLKKTDDWLKMNDVMGRDAELRFCEMIVCWVASDGDVGKKKRKNHLHSAVG